MLFQHVEELGRAERRRQARHERRVLERRAIDLLGHFAQPIQVHRPFDAIEVRLAQPELLQQELHHAERGVVGHFEPHGVAEVAMQQLSLQRGVQVLDLLLVDEEVGVARDAELVAADDIHAGEELADMGVQYRGEKDERILGARVLLRQTDQARQRARCLHDGGARAPPEGVAALQLDGEIQALVQHARERMRRVEPDRCQHREQLAEEILADPLLLRAGPFLALREHDAFARKRRQEHLVQQLVLLPDERMRLAAHRIEHFGATPRVRARIVQPELDRFLQPGDADLEELVQVRGDDGEEAQPLQQRHRLVRRLRQHAPVEGEDAELAVDELGGRGNSAVHGTGARARRRAKILTRAAGATRPRTNMTAVLR